MYTFEVQHRDSGYYVELNIGYSYPTPEAAQEGARRYAAFLIESGQGSGVLAMLHERTQHPVYRDIREAQIRRQNVLAETAEYCTRCGAADYSANVFCEMSDEGEGPHIWQSSQPAPILNGYGAHLEQGAEAE